MMLWPNATRVLRGFGLLKTFWLAVVRVLTSWYERAAEPY
jgi:hypothetical protein